MGHWAEIIRLPCADFYQGELDNEAQQEEQPQQQDDPQELQYQQELQDQQELQYQQELLYQQDLPPDQQQQQQEEPNTGRWAVEKPKRKMPWAVVSGAALAGAVPLIYHLGAAGPAA